MERGKTANATYSDSAHLDTSCEETNQYSVVQRSPRRAYYYSVVKCLVLHYVTPHAIMARVYEYVIQFRYAIYRVCLAVEEPLLHNLTGKEMR